MKNKQFLRALWAVLGLVLLSLFYVAIQNKEDPIWSETKKLSMDSILVLRKEIGKVEIDFKKLHNEAPAGKAAEVLSKSFFSDLLYIPFGNEFNHFLVANLIDFFIFQFRRSLGYFSISLFDLVQILFTRILVKPIVEWYSEFKSNLDYLIDEHWLVMGGVTGAAATSFAQVLANFVTGDQSRVLDFPRAPEYDLLLHEKYINSFGDLERVKLKIRLNDYLIFKMKVENMYQKYGDHN